MMTLAFVVGVLMGLAWGAVERHGLRRRIAEGEGRYAALWRAGAESLARQKAAAAAEADWRDGFDMDAQEGE